jgi:type I restriction-modification system DNA methylase subunit
LGYARAADETTRRGWRDAARQLLESIGGDILDRSTEVALQAAFINAVFVRLLGYAPALSGRSPFTLSEHVGTEVDATEADGTLGWYTAPGAGQTLAVVELKGARTSLDRRQLSRSDRLTPVDQAFLYATKFAGCEWVIVSNFLELRLYSTRHGQALFERFTPYELADDDRLLELVALLRPEALVGTAPTSPGYLRDLLVERPTVRERDITADFYYLYADKRHRLLQHFLEQETGATPQELIQATQKLLDRVLFICFAEDTRTLLPPDILPETARIAQLSRSRSPTRIWDEVKNLFRDIDEGRPELTPAIPAYNGGLFAYDELLDEQLSVSDTLALDLISLSQYDYRRTINVEILGHVFERSITDLEYLRHAHSVDPEGVEANLVAMEDARRELGVYYTPQWVTSYIVDATIGPMAAEFEFESRRLRQMTILDPACGSGAFLAEAYRYLLQLAEASLPEALPEEQLGLTGAEGVFQPSLYLEALHGVDLMSEAIEIARLSLWLASASPLERLQNLDGLVEANTIAPPTHTTGVVGELFSRQMAAGGFDAVIGNPPWGATLDYELDPSLELQHEGQVDSYELFIERGVRDALRPGGMFGFIIPDRILRPEGERVRRWLFDNYRVLEVIKLGEGVFADVFRAAVILIVKREPPAIDDHVVTLSVTKEDRAVLEQAGAAHLRGLLVERGGPVSRSRVVGDDHYDIPLGATDEDVEIMETMRERALSWVGDDGVFGPYGRGVELGGDGFVIRCNSCFEWQVGPRRRAQRRGGGYEDKVCEFCGVTMRDGEWEASAELIVEERPEDGSSQDRRMPGSGWAPLYIGDDISRYYLDAPKWIRLGVPNINYKDASLYAPPKLLIRQTGVAVNVAVDETDARCLQSAYVYRVREGVELDPYYVLACLASRAMLFFFHRLTNQTEWQSFPKLVHRTLQRLPIPDPDRAGRLLHDRIAEVARRRMGLAAEDAHDLDLQIEGLVMEAYGLRAEQRQRIMRTLRSVQRLRVIREMFPEDTADSALPV